MKYTLIILVLFCSSCVTISELNKQIINEHKHSIESSPFSSAKKTKPYIKVQKEYRQTYVALLDSIISANHSDTVYLIETHDYICINCPAYYVQIWTDQHFIKLEINDSNRSIYDVSIVKIEDLEYYSTSSLYYEIRKLKEEMKNGISWWNYPMNYGTEICSDGGHSFYTVFFNNQLESMYMRCFY